MFQVLNICDIINNNNIIMIKSIISSIIVKTAYLIE